MIEEQIKIHDKYSIELKLGYRARRKVNENNFGVNCWIFIPNPSIGKISNDRH